MRWLNKGSEIEKLPIYQTNMRKMWIFGAGEIGKGIYYTLQRFGLFNGFIDNDLNKQKKSFEGERVHSYDYLLKQKDPIVVVAANNLHEEEICKRLEADNIVYYRSGFFLDKILPVYLWKEKKILMMNLSQICLTERCTLHCKYCAHGCYAVDFFSKDMQLQDVFETADAFFSRIDYIHEFVLIGGEPLLYSDLTEVIHYIGERYRKKIGIYSITTNGTILPRDEILQASKEYQLYYRISNYVNAIPKLSKRYKELTNLLEQNRIEYYLGKAEEEWWDYGFRDYVDGLSEEYMIRKFDECATPCRETRNGKLYFCVMARTVSENLGYYIGQDDYLDLYKLPEGELGKRILLEFNLGYSDKGYLSMCRRCRGKESKEYPVKAAEQLSI